MSSIAVLTMMTSIAFIIAFGIGTQVRNTLDDTTEMLTEEIEVLRQRIAHLEDPSVPIIQADIGDWE